MIYGRPGLSFNRCATTAKMNATAETAGRVAGYHSARLEQNRVLGGNAAAIHRRIAFDSPSVLRPQV